MAAEEVEVASRFRAALETAVATGDHEPVLALVTPNVEWITPQVTLRGIEELRARRLWGSDAFDFEFGEGDWVDHGDGRVACEVRQVYREKGTAEVAYERLRRVEVTIQDRKICRYELLFSG